MILLERRGPILILTLNNPERYNALGGTLLPDLVDALEAAAADGEVRAIVLTGAGKGFCAGAQFGGDTFDSGGGIGEKMRRSINPLIAKLRSCPKPIVVAMNGAAAGAGVGVALAGDIVIAARSARFILSFVRLGAALDAGTSLLLQRAIGAPRARALSLLGEPLDAERAADWGLIWKCVDDNVLLDEALAAAQRLADGPPVSLGLIKGQLEAAWSADLGAALDGEADAQARAFVTDDLREGAAAFVEKRAPRFVGR
ncbi:2-(1,2-epoxy-1,2-dihydrophenyl)acetyl-CoA isomerase [Chelatococcus reniformis]|uniref:2-(1,2-epoxy-1,2-dihydrophenyl)acetyl-CoA isomerase n=2 Tax=Chelatococcus reniformis TaxID=1494448 RepID=A0A916UVY1_9HYPH|nr:2-(1,2-epoxy-1,2-dihydrophenyl)acetyl-CoA isomerase [Chelatococcus reniformis]